MTRMQRKQRRRDIVETVLLCAIAVILALLCFVLMVDSINAREEAVSEAQATIRRAQASLAGIENRRAMREAERASVAEQVIADAPAPLAASAGTFREDIPLDEALQTTLCNACKEFNVPIALALAVMEQESRFQMVVGDGGNSVGFFQVQERWWRWLMDEIGAESLHDPAQNIQTGCAVLGYLLERYGDTEDALTAYNTGRPGASAYAASVLERSAKWRTPA